MQKTGLWEITFTYFVGSHDGYTRLADPVVHRRHVLKIAGGLYLVRDIALGQSEHELEIRWHFAPDIDVQSHQRGTSDGNNDHGWTAIGTDRSGTERLAD